MTNNIANFSMRKSIYGKYIAVRVRDACGNSATVDQLYSEQETRLVYARLCAEMTPIQTPTELDMQIELAFGRAVAQ